MAITHVAIDAVALNVPASEVTVYIVGANSIAKAVSLSAHNTSGTSRVVLVHKVPSGGSVSATNEIATKTIGGNTSVVIDEVSVQTMGAGDFLALSQDIGTDVIVSGGATEVST